MKTVLVSGASGIVGYGILRSLRKSGEAFRLVGTSIYADSAANAFSDVFELAPKTTDADYVEWLRDLIARHDISVALPGIECDMLRWNDERSRLADTGCAFVLNTPEIIPLCGDKWSFYQKLLQSGSPHCIPTTLEGDYDSLAAAYGVPFLLKPRRGFASQGILRIHERAEFEAVSQELGPRLMAQPIVGDDAQEYTAAAFCDHAGAVKAHIILRRKLSSTGFTESAEVVSMPELLRAMEALAEVLRPVGPTNFQFRRHRGELLLLEVNPRISSATSIRTAFGYNEALMAVNFFLRGQVPEQPTLRRGRAVRYMEDHVVYEDRADI